MSKTSVSGTDKGSSSGQATRTRSFWTCVRLGMIEGRRSAAPAGPEPVSGASKLGQTAEEATAINVELVGEEDRERSARLKKRRSELNLGSA